MLEKDPNPNSVFTRELLARMKKPGVKIDDLMRDVQNSVEELSKSVGHEQRPAIYNETRGHFYFYNHGQNQQAIAPVMPSKPISNPLPYDVAISLSQKPSLPSSAVTVDCDRTSENNTISSNQAKNSNNKSNNVVVTSSHLRPKNPNIQTPANCNRDQ